MSKRSARYELLLGDCLERLSDIPIASCHCVVTSPPYLGLRDYGVEGQIGLEDDWREHLRVLIEVFGKVRRAMRPDATLWLNYGDMYAQGGRQATKEELNEDLSRATRNGYYTGAFSGYGGWNRASGTAIAGLKAKDLCGMPWRLALALQEEGWWLRADCIWSKANPMPSSVRDRPTVSHEYVFLLSPSARYFYDAEAVRVPLSTIEKRKGRIQYAGKSKKTSTFLPPNPAGRNLWTVQVGQEKSNQELMRECFEWAWSQMDPTSDLSTIWELACQAYRGSHFATFPEGLARTAILAGTSEHGACAACGAPWARIIEPTPEYAQRLGCDYANKKLKAQGINNGCPPAFQGSGLYITTGWEPTCICSTKEVVPCTVLDPFAGSGTTGVVALQNGRDFVGVELNPDYHKMANERLKAASLGLPIKEAQRGQTSLFEAAI